MPTNSESNQPAGTAPLSQFLLYFLTLGLLIWRKIPEPLLVAAAGIAGLLLFKA